ncbi:ATP-NAD kinase-like domain [Pseudocohnilembus persalinus]|uniref:Diacylglycerol kinase n=1 Tax=Pseudocohnilembus persalinus TaxID=266149 RepID=A0A0V0QZP6_PSEPJ|nr:ATP-NAD kinase-like domain [Pseudocohnilembus persalinus]|eukprot:KRX07365.1 ATP-NAD kinase-like domain [Pseudocohnilembus persalinus]
MNIRKLDKQENVKIKDKFKEINDQKYLQQEIKKEIQLVKIEKLSEGDHGSQHKQGEEHFSDSENEKEEQKNQIVAIDQIQTQFDQKAYQEQLEKQYQESKKNIPNTDLKHYFHLFVNKKSGNQSGKKLLEIPNLKLDFVIQRKVITKSTVISSNELKKKQQNQNNNINSNSKGKNDSNKNNNNNLNKNEMQNDNSQILNRNLNSEKKSNNNDTQFLNATNKVVNNNNQVALSRKYQSYQENEEYLCEIYFYDLYDVASKKKGFDLIKKQCETELLQNKCKIYSLVAGGDGSVLWLVEEMSKAGVNFDQVPLCMIPVGTGNDFSRASGWGPEESITNLIANNYKRLQKLMLRWIHAKVEYFDLWDFHFDTYEGGSFQKVYFDEKGKGKKLQMKEPESGELLRKYSRTMSNYFSIGVDARVGLGFDKKRTQSRSQNKCIYCLEGIKKFFQKNRNIQDTLENLIQIQNFDQQDIKNVNQFDLDHSVVFNTANKPQVGGNNVSNLNKEPEASQDNYIVDKEGKIDNQQIKNQQNNTEKNEKQQLNTDDDHNFQIKENDKDTMHLAINHNTNSNPGISNKCDKNNKKLESQDQNLNRKNQNGKNQDNDQNKKIIQVNKKPLINKVLKGKPYALVCLNIDSYAAGTHGIWKGSAKNYGIVNEEDKITPLKDYERYSEQKNDDKKIEIVAFDNLLSIPLEKVFSGRGQRIAQASGNNEGLEMLKLQPNYRNYKIQNLRGNKNQLNYNETILFYDVEFIFINLADKSSQQKGTEQIQQLLKEGEKQVSVITCGGDGTVMWTTQVIKEANIDFDQIPMGIVPLGTGNDFSRSLGWGPSSDIPGLLKDDCKKLKKLALKMIHAQVTDFDIWDISFSVFQHGDFKQVKKQNGQAVEKVIIDSETQKTLKELNKTFCNYFSTGVDARIGIDFDKNRTKSRIGNLCCYAWASCKRIFLKKPKVNHTLHSLHQVQTQQYINKMKKESSQIQNLNQDQNQNQKQKLNYNEMQDEQENDIENQITNTDQEEFQVSKIQVSETIDQVSFQDQSTQNTSTSNQMQVETVFVTRTGKDFKIDQQKLNELKKQDLTEYRKKIDKSNKYLKGSPNTIVMLNINSYAGGMENVWNNGVKKGALIDIANENYVQQQQNFVKQQFSDGKIEIVTFDSMLNMGLGRVLPKQANRIAQGQGPYQFDFREKDQNGETIKAYFQIDGEFYIVTAPKQIIVKKSEYIKGGKFKVLVEQNQYKKIQSFKN